MKERGWGRILNVSSIYGQRGAANRVGYVTTKTALIGLTRAVALEVVGSGVTCNAVCPGTTETPVHEATIQAMMTTGGLSRGVAEKAFMAGKQPTGRIIAADDVAQLMVFLCGPASSDINGSIFPIDAGWSAG
jgi:3-hydroxybutyrate dehydrogenase